MGYAITKNFPTRESMGDADKTFSAGISEIYLGSTLTAPRTLTLPAANSLPAGGELIFVDEVGGITATNTVTITRAGADTINGSTTSIVSVTNAITRLITDGTSKWTANVAVPYVQGSWIPTWTGFSADPTSVSATYILIGKFCWVSLTGVAGTSNSTALTVTLPFTSKYTRPGISLGLTSNNTSSFSDGRGDLAASSSVLTCYIAQAATAFTNSGAKMVRLNFGYEIE